MARADHQFEVERGEGVEQFLDCLGGFAGFQLGNGVTVGSGPLGEFALGHAPSLARSPQRTAQRRRRAGSKLMAIECCHIATLGDRLPNDKKSIHSALSSVML